MHVDPFLQLITIIVFMTIFFGLVLQVFKLPPVIGYIIIGILIGPATLNLINDDQFIKYAGNIGLILMMFFVGMEISPTGLLKKWLAPACGVILKICISFVVLLAVGYFFEWSYSRTIYLSFILSLSSTAIVITILEINPNIGIKIKDDIVGVLLIQDLAIIPMLIVLNTIGGENIKLQQIIFQVIGGIICIAVALFLSRKKEIKMPLLKKFTKNNETELFASLAICLGTSLITGFLYLSAALGAFIAGMIINTAKETIWVKQNLAPLKTIFLAIFFMSIGMMIDISFIRSHYIQLICITTSAFIINNIIYYLVFRTLRESKDNSINNGALLSQTGEFGFVIASMAISANVISLNEYQYTISVIILSLIFSPIWIYSVKNITLLLNKL